MSESSRFLPVTVTGSYNYPISILGVFGGSELSATATSIVE